MVVEVEVTVVVTEVEVEDFLGVSLGLVDLPVEEGRDLGRLDRVKED